MSDNTPGAPGSGEPDPEREEQSSEHDLSHEELVDVGPAAEEEETVLSDDDLDILSGQTTADELAAERLADLQRVTAEYANYRKRTEANREVERERAVSEAVKGLIPVLDDLERAEKHGDLTEGSAFSTIAAKLRTNVERLGLTPYGEKGEPFDPQIHEAIFQQPTPDVTADTVAEVVETGYRLGSTTVRVAKVVVSVPA
ncbi:nucleotide exchange factor GrpE [Leifsonia sp. NPDC058194]|uniref:nucleotide exchange factor GrpE n=1 Tax=Leifsonia sp. NPDC058194 TaxID=3346374 RepID=UPI0036DA3918